MEPFSILWFKSHIVISGPSVDNDDEAQIVADKIDEIVDNAIGGLQTALDEFYEGFTVDRQD